MRSRCIRGCRKSFLRTLSLLLVAFFGNPESSFARAQHAVRQSGVVEHNFEHASISPGELGVAGENASPRAALFPTESTLLPTKVPHSDSPTLGKSRSDSIINDENAAVPTVKLDSLQVASGAVEWAARVAEDLRVVDVDSPGSTGLHPASSRTLLRSVEILVDQLLEEREGQGLSPDLLESDPSPGLEHSYHEAMERASATADASPRRKLTDTATWQLQVEETASTKLGHEEAPSRTSDSAERVASHSDSKSQAAEATEGIAVPPFRATDDSGVPLQSQSTSQEPDGQATGGGGTEGWAARLLQRIAYPWSTAPGTPTASLLHQAPSGQGGMTLTAETAGSTTHSFTEALLSGTPEYYYPYGTQVNVSEAALLRSGWQLCYDGPYYSDRNMKAQSEEASMAQDGSASAASTSDGFYFARCTGESLLVGARHGAEVGMLAVAAAGAKAEVLRETGREGESRLHNGAYWYHLPGGSVGFAESGAVRVAPWDLQQRFVRCERRVSWRVGETRTTVKGEAAAEAGGRAGCAVLESELLQWHKVAYHHIGQHVLPRNLGARANRRVLISDLPVGCTSSTCLEYNGKFYRTLDLASHASTSLGCQMQYMAIPDGWEIPFDDAFSGSDSWHVAKLGGWATHVLVWGFQHGSCPSRGTTTYSSDCSSYFNVRQSGHTYKPSGCYLRILLRESGIARVLGENVTNGTKAPEEARDFYGFYGFYGLDLSSTDPETSDVAPDVIDGLGDNPNMHDPLQPTPTPPTEPPEGVRYRDPWLRTFSGSAADAVDLPPVAAPGSSPRTIHLHLRTTASTGNFVVVSTGTAAERHAFNIVSYGSRGRCVGVTGHLHDFHPGHRGHPRACTTVNDGVWHHVAVTLDDVGTLIIYVDGREDNRALDRRFNTSGQTNFLGRSNDDAHPDPFTGQVYAATFLPRALTPVEIAALAAGTVPNHGDPLPGPSPHPSPPVAPVPAAAVWIEPAGSQLPPVTLRPGERHTQWMVVRNEGNEEIQFEVRIEAVAGLPDIAGGTNGTYAVDPERWLHADPREGKVRPGGGADVAVSYDASGIEPLWESLLGAVTVRLLCSEEVCIANDRGDGFGDGDNSSSVRDGQLDAPGEAVGLPASRLATLRVVEPYCGLTDGSSEVVLRNLSFTQREAARSGQAEGNATEPLGTNQSAANGADPGRGGSKGPWSSWGGENAGVGFELQVLFAEFNGGPKEVAAALEVQRGRITEVSESVHCGALEMMVEGAVILEDPWVTNSTVVVATYPTYLNNVSVHAAYDHRPVFELFGMDMIAASFGHLTDKPNVLINVIFSELVTPLNQSGLDLGSGLSALSVLPMIELPWGFHIHVSFEEDFLGDTYVSINAGAVQDLVGGGNAVTANLSLTRYHSLPFVQTTSYEVEDPMQHYYDGGHGHYQSAQ